MAYDEGLAERLRELLRGESGITEKKMFGGLAFMSRGHMFVGIVGDSLMARVGPSNYRAALARPQAREMDFTGKPMKGIVFVDPPGIEDDRELQAWVDESRLFVLTLPAKGV